MQRRLSFIVPPLKQCDLSRCVLPEGSQHPPYRLAVALDDGLVNVLVLVGVLERRIRCNDGL